MNEVLRQEKKFLISQEKLYSLSGQVADIMHADTHGTSQGYLIRSLYFDSYDNRDYREKEDGVELRRKIRLRNYGPDSNFAKLEMKQKQGPLQKKRSLTLSKEDSLQLIAGNYHVLLQYSEPFAGECYYVMNQYHYRPVTVITYWRKAFVGKENNIRVTFDHHIKATESDFNIFDPQINENYIMNPYLAVLEVKFNGFLLSYIKDILRQCDGSETTVSKYFMGRAWTQTHM